MASRKPCYSPTTCFSCYIQSVAISPMFAYREAEWRFSHSDVKSIRRSAGFAIIMIVLYISATAYSSLIFFSTCCSATRSLQKVGAIFFRCIDYGDQYDFRGAGVVGRSLFEQGSGRSILGAQGDEWDAQKDMALAALRLIFAMFVTRLTF